MVVLLAIGVNQIVFLYEMTNVEPFCGRFPNHQIIHVQHLLLIRLVKASNSNQFVPFRHFFEVDLVSMVSRKRPRKHLVRLLVVAIHTTDSLETLTRIFEHSNFLGVFVKGK
mgnify:CR=1 FL=1